jgi:hypothetical protein
MNSSSPLFIGFGVLLIFVGGLAQAQSSSQGLVPLDELSHGAYRNQSGGLYAKGSNVRPGPHDAAGLAEALNVVPLNAAGGFDPGKGKIGLVAIGLSNTRAAFDAFLRLVAQEKGVNDRLIPVNAAARSDEARELPDGLSPGSAYWTSVDEAVRRAGLSRRQIQVVWLRETTRGSSGSRASLSLTQGLASIVQVVRKRFPNARLAYLSARTYCGYARPTSGFSPEPQAYEDGFSVKRLIQAQIQGSAELAFAASSPRSPWLSWGPYSWGEGVTPRADGLKWKQDDFLRDGFHLSPTGQRKVAERLLRFFKTDTTTRGWFLAPQSPPPPPLPAAPWISEDFENGLGTQWRTQTAAPKRIATPRLRVAGKTSRVVSMEVFKGDSWVANGPRSEIRPVLPRWSEGEEVWVGGRILFPRDYLDDPAQEVVWQVCGEDSVPFLIRSIGAFLEFRGRSFPDFRIRKTKGAWMDIVVGHRFSSSERGRTRIYVNGKLLLDQAGSTMRPNTTLYQKLGIYKSGWKRATGSSTTQRKLYYDDIRIGPRRIDVMR